LNVVCEEGCIGEYAKEKWRTEGCLQHAKECIARRREMSHKKVMLVFILVFGLSLLSISAFAQGEDLGERVTIYPWEIWDGEITVSTDDTVVLGARWGACTKGLAQAWTRTSYINYTINGEPLFSSQKEAREYWGRPYPVMNLEPDNCVNGSETIWIVAWEYELGLNEGDYQVHFEMGTTHPFHDGFDSDGDGKPDPQVFDIQFDFEIIVIEAGAISGTVIEDGGGPLEGLDVVACSIEIPDICVGAMTDADGRYFIYPVPEGDYRVFVYPQDGWVEEYYLWLGEFYNDASTFNDALLVPVVGGPDPLVIDFALTQAGTVSGMVFESDGITPIPNIGVDVAEGWHGACTDENGYYMIGSLPFGTYDIVAGRDFCGVGGYVETIVENVTVILEAPNVEELNFILERGGSISGRVTNDQNGEGIPGVWVDTCEEAVSSENMWGQFPFCGGDATDEEGYYTIPGLIPGNYRVHVSGSANSITMLQLLMTLF
jgi:hypothetical protein